MVLIELISKAVLLERPAGMGPTWGKKKYAGKQTLKLLIIQRKYFLSNVEKHSLWLQLWYQESPAQRQVWNIIFFSTEHFVLSRGDDATQLWEWLNTHTHTHSYMFEQLTGFHLAAAATGRMCQSCSAIIIWRMLSFTVISYLLIPHLNPVSLNPGTYCKCISTSDKTRALCQIQGNTSRNN